MDGHVPYDGILSHLGHKIVVAYYGEMPEPVNVAIECEDCHEVIVNCDHEEHRREEGDQQEAAGLDQYDLERCVCTLCDHLDDFEDLDRMSNGDFTEDEEAEIWSTFSRDATKEEIAAIKAMIFARYCKFIGKG